MPVKVGMVSLGCPKNQVDAEIMLSLISGSGYELCADARQCEVVIVNTCGFIESAKAESIEAVLEYAQLKGEGVLKVLVVTGCLAERYREELAAELPEADVVLGIGKNTDIVRAIQAALAGRRTVSFGRKDDLLLTSPRVLSTPPYYAYLRVADGCNNRCSYCAIPLIRGDFRSRPMEEIVAEAQTLVAQGVTELSLIAQDTTRYGEDIYGHARLPELLAALCKVEGLHWLRILYAYPQTITDELINVIAREDKIVKYIDLPLQHVSGRILRAMRRPGDVQSTRTLIKKLRERIPGVVIRTTFIAGFPGETEQEFEELCEFIQEARFERLGCFAYSEEEGTAAADMGEQLGSETKQRRADMVMMEQMRIAQEIAAALKGRTLEVLTEGYDAKRRLYTGRSYMDAPDIDTKVYFQSERTHRPGDYVKVLIAGAADYDLIGRALPEGVESREPAQ